uniref:Transmembrane protein n=1 Tax=Favella ehrenbergii TaxID=182087 RepID=A0A7S3I741_9SPIT
MSLQQQLFFSRLRPIDFFRLLHLLSILLGAKSLLPNWLSFHWLSFHWLGLWSHYLSFGHLCHCHNRLSHCFSGFWFFTKACPVILRSLSRDFFRLCGPVKVPKVAKIVICFLWRVFWGLLLLTETSPVVVCLVALLGWRGFAFLLFSRGRLCRCYCRLLEVVCPPIVIVFLDWVTLWGTNGWRDSLRVWF